MDPDATWLELRDTFLERQWLDVADLAQELLDWLQGGGFPPHFGNDPSRRETDREWDKLVALQAARAALRRANREIRLDRRD